MLPFLFETHYNVMQHDLRKWILTNLLKSRILKSTMRMEISFITKEVISGNEMPNQRSLFFNAAILQYLYGQAYLTQNTRCLSALLAENKRRVYYAL